MNDEEKRLRDLCLNVASDIRLAIKNNVHLESNYAAGHTRILEICAERLEAEKLLSPVHGHRFENTGRVCEHCEFPLHSAGAPDCPRRLK